MLNSDKLDRLDADYIVSTIQSICLCVFVVFVISELHSTWNDAYSRPNSQKRQEKWVRKQWVVYTATIHRIWDEFCEICAWINLCGFVVKQAFSPLFILCQHKWFVFILLFFTCLTARYTPNQSNRYHLAHPSRTPSSVSWSAALSLSSSFLSLVLHILTHNGHFWCFRCAIKLHS